MRSTQLNREGGGSGGGLRKKIKLNTGGCCFLCLSDSVDDIHEKNTGNNSCGGHSVSLSVLRRYLQISLSKEFTSSVDQSFVRLTQALQSLKKSDFVVEVCERCQKVVEKASELVQMFEILGMELNYRLQNIRDCIAEGDRSPQKVKEYQRRMKSDICTFMFLESTENLRRVFANKCSKRVASALPKVRLSRITPICATERDPKVIINRNFMEKAETIMPQSWGTRESKNSSSSSSVEIQLAEPFSEIEDDFAEELFTTVTVNFAEGPPILKSEDFSIISGSDISKLNLSLRKAVGDRHDLTKQLNSSVIIGKTEFTDDSSPTSESNKLEGRHPTNPKPEITIQDVPAAEEESIMLNEEFFEGEVKLAPEIPETNEELETTSSIGTVNREDEDAKEREAELQRIEKVKELVEKYKRGSTLQCRECLKKFKTLGSKVYHYKTQHTTLYQKCEVNNCTFYYNTVCDLEKYKRHCNASGRARRCPMGKDGKLVADTTCHKCKKTFYYPSCLNRHVPKCTEGSELLLFPPNSSKNALPEMTNEVGMAAEEESDMLTEELSNPQVELESTEPISIQQKRAREKHEMKDKKETENDRESLASNSKKCALGSTPNLSLQALVTSSNGPVLPEDDKEREAELQRIEKEKELVEKYKRGSTLQCRECLKKFKTRGEREYHYKTQHTTFYQKCEVKDCFYYYNTVCDIEKYKRHRNASGRARRCPMGKDGRLVADTTCHKCKRTFAHPYRLKRHVQKCTLGSALLLSHQTAPPKLGNVVGASAEIEESAILTEKFSEGQEELESTEPISIQQKPAQDKYELIQDKKETENEKVHSASNSKKCEFCPKIFISEKVLKMHCILAHKKDLQKC